MPLRHLIPIIAVLLVGFWLRAAGLIDLPPGISSDEAVNVIDAHHVAHSGVYPLYQDVGRAEPLFRAVQALAAGTLGSEVWLLRLTSAFAGLLTLAALYRAVLDVLHEARREVRHGAALLACVALAVTVGHVAITRTTYRAMPLPLFMLLATSALARGLRHDRWRDFAWLALWLAAALYTYTAAYVLPLALLPLGLWRMRRWGFVKRLAFTGVLLLLLMSPVIVRYLQIPESVLGRVADVSAEADTDWPERLRQMLDQLVREGDENPQYNVALAPIIPAALLPIFGIGLLALLVRWRQPLAVWVAALLILSSVPALASNEITHGLRVIGVYAVYPLIVAYGVALMVSLWPGRVWWLGAARMLAIYGVGVLLLVGAEARVTYVRYFQQPEAWRQWPVYGVTLDHNEWFFRTDQRALADWLTAQDAPLLLPTDALNQTTLRVWLLNDYPQVVAAADLPTLPPDTQVVRPWSLERGGFWPSTQHWALLQGKTITLLPPLVDASSLHAAAQTPTQAMAQGRPLAAFGALPRAATLHAQPMQPVQGALFNAAVQVVGWSGQRDLIANENVLTLYWRALRGLDANYWSFAQIQTQAFERITGTDQPMLRTLYPSSIWPIGASIPEAHTLRIPDDLPAGAYRLVAGVYAYAGYPLPVAGSADGRAMLGWLKVPQPNPPALPDVGNLSQQVTIADVIALDAAHIDQTPAGYQVRLWWRGLSAPTFDATVFVHLLDADGALLAQDDRRPWGGQYPTQIWGAGERVQTTHSISVPDGAGVAEVRVGLYVFEGAGTRRLPLLVDAVHAAEDAFTLPLP